VEVEYVLFGYISENLKLSYASTLQRFNASTLQRFNASTLQRFNYKKSPKQYLEAHIIIRYSLLVIN